MDSKKNFPKILFEVVRNYDQKTVYKRKIAAKGRTSKEVNEVVENLPTATIYTYSLDEFNHLKKIEEELYKKYELNDSRTSWKNKLFSFLEI